jgi:hypothetical protein
VRPQVLLFTATMPVEVEGVAERWVQPAGAGQGSGGGVLRLTVGHSADSISKTITQAGQVWSWVGSCMTHEHMGTYVSCPLHEDRTPASRWGGQSLQCSCVERIAGCSGLPLLCWGPTEVLL